MTNKQLFKEAIAEAKSIREAAIINAKEALEETLTPQIKSLLAQRLAEMEEEDIQEEEEMLEQPAVAEAENEEEEEASAEEEEEQPSEEEAEGESEDEDIDVASMSVDDLKDLIRDIAAEVSAEMMPGMEEPAGEEAPEDLVGAEMDTEEEEIDLDELLAELEEEAVSEEELSEEPVAEEQNSQVQEDLQEALKTINTLRAQLQEVNLLNAKLLYVNKIFKSSKNLSEAQKANIISTFDKATSAKEAQLVYESLKTTLTVTKSTRPAKIVESKLGMASKPAGVAPKKTEIITEVSDAVKRMQKLAGIIK